MCHRQTSFHSSYKDDNRYRYGWRFIIILSLWRTVPSPFSLSFLPIFWYRTIKNVPVPCALHSLLWQSVAQRILEPPLLTKENERNSEWKQEKKRFHVAHAKNANKKGRKMKHYCFSSYHYYWKRKCLQQQCSCHHSTDVDIFVKQLWLKAMLL